MTDVSDLINTAANGPAPSVDAPAPPTNPGQEKLGALMKGLPQQKQQEVAATADAKRVALGGMPDEETFKSAAIARVTGAGVASANPIEHDFATMAWPDVEAKYGPEAASNLLHATTNYRNLSVGNRGTDGLISVRTKDLFKSAALGAGEMVGGIGALGLSGLDAIGRQVGADTHMGVWASKEIKDAADRIEGTESPYLRNLRKANQEKGELNTRDNAAQAEIDKANGDGEIVSGLKEIGRNALDSFGNVIENPTLLSDASAGALGSVVAGGPIAKGVGLTGKIIAPAVEKAATLGLGGVSKGMVALNEAGAPRAAQLLGDAASGVGKVGKYLPGEESIGVGAMFGGGSYQQTAANIASMDPEELKAKSPYFRELLTKGMSPEDAQAQVADKAGQMAGAIAAPAGMVAGALAKSVIKSPFTSESLPDAAYNVVKSTGEQALQGGAGQAANNVGEQQYADPNKDLTQGVGEAMGSSLAGGLGAGVVMAAPGAAVHTAGVAKDAVKASFNARLDKLAAANEAKNPSSDANISAASAAASEAMQDRTAHESLADAVIRAHTNDDITPENRAKDVSLADKITRLGVFSSKEVSSEGLDPELKTDLDGTTNRVDALLHMANSVNEHGADSIEGLSAARELNKFLGHYEDLINSDQRAFAAIDDHEPAGKLNNEFNVLADHLMSNPTIQKAMTKVRGLSEEAITKLVNPITEESLKSGKAQTDAENIAGLAAIVPENSNLDAINSVLKHATEGGDGKLHLSAEQHQALLAAWSLLTASKDSIDRQKKMGNKNQLNSVSSDVLSEPGKKGDTALSALAFTKRIFNNMRAGNVDAARQELRNFGMFTDHMANKSDAVNTHYTNGDGKSVPFKARNSETNEWYKSYAPIIHPKNAVSVELAQRINLEAKRTNDIYNNLTKAFPELKGKEKSVADLHPNLIGDSNAVAKAHSKNERVQPKTDKSVVPVEADAEGAPASIVPVGSSEAGSAQKDEAPALLKAPTVGKNYIAAEGDAPFGSKEEAHQAILEVAHDPAKYNIEPVTTGEGFIAHLKNEFQGEATTGTKDVPPVAQASDEEAKLPTESELAKAHKFEEGLSKLTSDEVWDKYSAYHDKHNNRERTPYEQLIWDALEREYLRRNPEEAKVSEATPGESLDRETDPKAQPKDPSSGKVTAEGAALSDDLKTADYNDPKARKDLADRLDKLSDTDFVAVFEHSYDGKISLHDPEPKSQSAIDKLMDGFTKVLGLDDASNFVRMIKGVLHASEPIKRGGEFFKDGPVLGISAHMLGLFESGDIPVEVLRHIVSHELTHAIDFHAAGNGLMASHGDEAFQIGSSLWEEFQAMKDKLSEKASIPLYDYIERDPNKYTQAQEFFAELGAFVLSRPDLAEELIPNGTKAFHEVVEKAQDGLAAHYAVDPRASDAGLPGRERSLPEQRGSDTSSAKPVERDEPGQPERVEHPKSVKEVYPDLIGAKEETTSKPTTTEDLYPDLVGTKQEDGSLLKNWFHEAFEVPKDHEETGSRLLGLEKPYEAVRYALSSDERLKEFLGKDKRLAALPSNIARAFKAYLGLVPDMQKIMEDRLTTKLGDVNDPKSPGANLLTGKSNRWAETRVFNLVEQKEDGSFAYNKQLAEQAIMAGLHWLLVSDRFASKMDANLAGALTGVPSDKADSFVDRLAVGLSPLEAKRSLADRIVKFWGLKENKNADNGHTQGIAEAMAVEVLKALEGLSLPDEDAPNGRQGLLKVQKFYVMSDDSLQTGDYTKTPGTKVVRSLQRIISNLAVGDLLHAAPSLIEEAVLREPEDKNYYGGDKIKVPDTQMNNPSVRNTRADKEQIEKSNAEPHYLNTHMHDLYTAIGNSGLLDLFGGGSDLQERIEKGTINNEHASSLDGKNTTVRSAWEALQNRVSEMKTRPLGLEEAIHYANNISAIGRLQQLGGQTPQGSKLIRAAILPTWSNLDLRAGGEGKADHLKFWTMGLAQALGVKIHTLDPFDAQGTSGNTLNEKVSHLIENRFSKSIEMLQDHLNNSNKFSSLDFVDQLKSDFAGAKDEGASLTENAVQALLEHARWVNSSDEEKANFKTSLYVEADGMTNGLANAIHLLSTGRFTSEEFTRLARAGHFFDGTKTMNEHRTRDGVDLYEQASERQQKHLDDMYDRYDQKNPDVTRQMDNVNTVLGRLVKGVRFDPTTGDVDVSRDVTKNPATITVYGSGPKGIASKLTDNLVRKLYEKFSGAAEILHDHPEADIHEALMGKGATVDDLKKFQDAFNQLLTRKTDKNFGSLSMVNAGHEPIDFSKFTKKDFVDFSLSKAAFENIQTNVHHLFVDPMVKGINDTVGKPLLNSKKAIQKASQVQSIVLEHLFKAAVAKLQAEKAKDPTYSPTDGISQNETDAIQRELLKKFPMIEAPGQRFFPVGRDTSDVKNVTSSGLDGAFKTNVQIHGPSDGGVKVLATVNVGMGDGKTMQTAINKYGVGGLHVFDGNNLALDKIADGSQKMNQAVSDAWQGNSIRAVLKSFEIANSNITADMFDKNLNLRRKISEVLFGEDSHLVDGGTLKAAFDTLRDTLGAFADSVDDRHQVMHEFESHIDNMAGAQESYKSPGIALTGSHEDIANRMNARLDEVQQENTKKRNQTKEKEISLKNAKDLEAVMDSVEFSPEQNLIMREVDRSGALKDYAIKTGDFDGASENTQGFIDVTNKVIHLISPTAETITHEAIHAATFNKVLAHYEGQDLGPRSREIQKAVGNLEKLMDQFLKLNIADVGENQHSYRDAVAAINEYRNDVDTPLNKARALNEFMAWSLSNQGLVDTLKGVPVHFLVQMAKNVWEQIKNIVFGSKLDVSKAYAHVLFNTAIIAREQPTVADLNRKVMLFQNSTYGTDARLSGFNKTFSDMFSRFLKEDDTIKTRATALVKSNTDAADLMAMANAQGFYMDQQARGVFTKVVSALASKMTLDPNSLVAISELYQHVSENLTSDMLMDPNIVDQQQAGELAKRKYDMLMGNAGSRKDAQGRSSLMPVFLGLSLVDDGLRDALRQMDLPKGEKHLGGTTNDWLRNTANDQLQGMSEIFAGQGKAKNVQDAIDNLTKQIGKTALDANSAMEQLALAPNAGINRANEIFVDFVGRVVDVVRDQNQKIQSDPTKSNFVKKAADIAEFVANFATQEGGERIAEGVTTFMNKLTNKNWRDVQEIVSEITGRSQSNGGPYDYIKLASTMIGQVRQQYRDHFPELFNEQFKRKLEKNEQSNMHLSMGRTDLAALLSSGSHSSKDVLNMLHDERASNREIRVLETSLKAQDPQHFDKVQAKAQQLADHMVNRTQGKNLLLNAQAVSDLLQESPRVNRVKPDKAYVDNVDRLTTLYALNKLPPEVRKSMRSLVQSEPDGMNFVLSYLKGNRSDETKKATGMALYNSRKGYIPSVQQEGVSLRVAKDSEAGPLLAQSYVRIGDYKGSKAEENYSTMGYYYAPVSNRAGFSQGIIQNAAHTSGGVEVATGKSMGLTGGRITNPAAVERISKQLAREGSQTTENLQPIFNDKGKLVAYERSIDPTQLSALNQDTHMGRMIGVWQGRQVEEGLTQEFNKSFVDVLHDNYKNASKDEKQGYVDLNDPKSWGNDKVNLDALHLMTPETREYIKDKFGEQFMVRRDLINDAIGYRKATIGDAWTGNCRWSDETQAGVRNLCMSVFGNKAYAQMVNSENDWKYLVREAKTNIVVKSVIVPLANFASNLLQLASRGVPMAHMATSIPKKIAEAEAYQKGRLALMKAEGQLRAAEGAQDFTAQLKLKNKIEAINDRFTRLSIWPLIKAGEFGSISHSDMSKDDQMLTGGRLHDYVDKQISKLPKAVQNAGDLALIGKDTALFQGLAKSVEYGDFLGKAIQYDHYVNKKGFTEKQALARITEEYVNFDRLPGRSRGYLDEMGMMWFFNFKLRTTKVALSMLRENPLQALIGTMMPAHQLGLGTPFADNIVSKTFAGHLGYSLGPAMMLHSPMLNPLAHLLGKL